MFPAQAVTKPLDAQQGSDSAAAALRSFIANPPLGLDYHATQWRQLYQSDTVALFATSAYPGAGGGPELAYVEFHNDGSTWRWYGQGYCVPRAAQPGKNAAEWRLVSPVAPTPQTTVLKVKVTEIACAGGQSTANRTGPPQIDYTADAVIVTFLVNPLPSGTLNTCPGNPWFDRTITLREPLGHRQLLDGDMDPPHPACLANPAEPSMTGQEQQACQLPD